MAKNQRMFLHISNIHLNIENNDNHLNCMVQCNAMQFNTN